MTAVAVAIAGVDNVDTVTIIGIAVVYSVTVVGSLADAVVGSLLALWLTMLLVPFG